MVGPGRSALPTGAGTRGVATVLAILASTLGARPWLDGEAGRDDHPRGVRGPPAGVPPSPAGLPRVVVQNSGLLKGWLRGGPPQTDPDRAGCFCRRTATGIAGTP